MVQSLVSLANRALALTKKLDWVVLLVARVTVGGLFVSTGWGKVHNLAKVTAYFHELGIPMPGLNAVLASFSELICGTLLLVGLASRLASLPLVVTMTVALLTALRGNIHGFPDLFGQVEWTYLVILLTIAVFGPGLVSIDALVVRRFGALEGRTEDTVAPHQALPRHP
jgi:putative oxidoreductase